jgi:hypothetical protein
MPKLPTPRRRRQTKLQKAVSLGKSALVLLPMIRLARRGWGATRVLRFGPVGAVVLGLLLFVRRRRRIKQQQASPWEMAGGAAPLRDASAVPGTPPSKPHGDTLAEGLPEGNETPAPVSSVTPDPGADAA